MKFIAMAVLSLVPTISVAGYISNKGQWDDLSAHQKDGYAMGFMDEHGTLYSTLDEFGVQMRRDYNQCLFDLEIDSGDLVGILDTGYADLENWDSAPTLVLLKGIHRVCKNKINEYRAERGETPFD